MSTLLSRRRFLREIAFATAQVLEYWLEVSRFSGWKKPAVPLTFRPDVFRQDLAAYARRGIRHVTSFAVFIDADYVRRYGPPNEVEAYGRELIDYRIPD